MRLIAVLFLASCAWAQVDAPRLGFLAEQGRVRPILGIAESAIVAPALDAGPFARIATARDTVLASDAATGAVLLYRGESFQPLEGATPSPDLIALSAGGAAAVLWYTGRSTAEIVTNLHATPAIRQVTAPFRPTTPTLAVSDDGEWLAGIWSGTVYVFGPDRQPAPVHIDGRPGALAFGAGAELAVASSSGIYRIADIGSSAAATQVLAADLRPVGVAFAGTSVLALDASGAIHVDTRGDRPADCHCTAEALTPLSPGLFRISELHDGATLFYDARTGQVRFAPLSLAEASR